MPHGDGATPAKKSVLFIELQKLFPAAEKRAIDNMASAVNERISRMSVSQKKKALKEILTGVSEEAIEDIAYSFDDWAEKVKSLVESTKTDGNPVVIYDMKEIGMSQDKIEEFTAIVLESWYEKATDNIDGLSKAKLGPALAVAFNKNTGKCYVARNLIHTEIITDNDGKKYPANINLHPYTDERLNKLYESKEEKDYVDENGIVRTKNIFDSYDFTKGAGTHAECLALNASLIDEHGTDSNLTKTDLQSTTLHIVKTRSGDKFERCPHCKFITSGSNLSPDYKKYEDEVYKEKYPKLVFD